MPARSATERDEDAITAWRDVTWQEVNPPGGDRRVHLLRRRSGRDRPSAQGPHLGPARQLPTRGAPFAHEPGRALRSRCHGRV